MSATDIRRLVGRVVLLSSIACLPATTMTAHAREKTRDPQQTTQPATGPAAADGAPELTAKASQAIDRGLKYLLLTQQKSGSFD